MQSKPLINRINNFSYLLEDMIGKGAAGKVYQGINELTGEQVAIKILEMSEIDNEVTQYLLACEKEALLSIKCQYVLFAYEIIQKEHQCYIITPMCTGGTLKEYIQNKGKLQESEAFSIFLKLLCGYKSIKEKQFIHRDLKSSNIMFNKGDPIIIDFGYCEKTKGSKPKVFYNVGSPSYMSPEAYYKTIYSEKSDLWALGIILYEMLEGNTVDFGIGIDRYFGNVVKNGVSFRGNYSEECKRVLKDILNPNPSHRPGVDQLIQKIEQMISGNGQSHTRSIQSHSQPHFKPQSHPLPQSHNQHHIQNYPHIQQHPHTQHHSQNQFQYHENQQLPHPNPQLQPQPQPQLHQYQAHHQNHYQNHQPIPIPFSNKTLRQNAPHLQSTPALFLNERLGIEQENEFAKRNVEVPHKGSMNQHYQQVHLQHTQKIQQHRESQEINSSQNVYSRNNENMNKGNIVSASNQQVGEAHLTQHYQAIPQYRHTLPVQNSHFIELQNQNQSFQNQINNPHQQKEQQTNLLQQRFSENRSQPHEQIQQHGQIRIQNEIVFRQSTNESHQINGNQLFFSNEQHQQQPENTQKTQPIHQNVQNHQNEFLYHPLHHVQHHPHNSHQMKQEVINHQNLVNQSITNQRHEEGKFKNEENRAGKRWPVPFGEPQFIQQKIQYENVEFSHGQARNQQPRPQSQSQQITYHQSRPQSIILNHVQNNQEANTFQNPQIFSENPHHSLFLPGNGKFSNQRVMSSTMLAQPHPQQSTFVPFEHVPNVILTDSVHHNELNSSFQHSNQNSNLNDRINIMNQSNTCSNFSLRSSLENNQNNMNLRHNENNINNLIRNGYMVNSLILNPQSNEHNHHVHPDIVNPVYRSFMFDGHQNNRNNFPIQQHHFGNPVQQVRGIQTQQAQQVQHQTSKMIFQEGQQFPQGNFNFPQHSNAQMPIHNIRQDLQNISRPFSPITVERRSMPINEEFFTHPEFHIPTYPTHSTEFHEQSQQHQPTNFLKKAEPYFHMSNKDPQIPTNQKPKLPLTKMLNPNKIEERKKKGAREAININIGYY